MPRYTAAGSLRVYSRDWLPDTVRREFDAGGPIIDPYSELGRGWHAYAGSFVPEYGLYARSLIGAGALPNDGALDLACGTGIQATALATLFRKVYALDVNPHMLRSAKEALRHHRNVELIEADFRSFSLPEQVDIVVSSGDSLNYVRSASELVEVFGCVAATLRPEGRFVFDVQSERSFRGCSRSVMHRLASGVEWLQVHAYDPVTRVDEARAITRSGVENHRRVYLSSDEVHDAARRAGLRSSHGFDGPALRYLARMAGRDFYELRRMS